MLPGPVHRRSSINILWAGHLGDALHHWRPGLGSVLQRRGPVPTPEMPVRLPCYSKQLGLA